MSQENKVFVPESEDLLTAEMLDVISNAREVIYQKLAENTSATLSLAEYMGVEKKVRHDQQARIVQLELRNNNQMQTINRYQTENTNLRQQIINLEKRSSAQANTINELLGDVPQ